MKMPLKELVVTKGKLMRFIIVILFSIHFSALAEDVCFDYNPSTDIEYGSQITVSGFLRPNKMFQGEDFGNFESISMVLVSDTPLRIQGGEINNPIACAMTEFTLHLSSEQISTLREMMLNKVLVTVQGIVRMAESSIEEYDNAVLSDISIIQE